ncbi:hypothetical protein NDK25_22110 [Niallia taxi]|nr:hypothetical protein [Niallia taxi]MDE5054913.1 hypothetical protein [Niallia taxi]
MESSLRTYQEQKSEISTQGLIAYFMLLLIPHTVLYMVISNFHDIKLGFFFLIIYSAFMAFLFIQHFEIPHYLLVHLIYLTAGQNALAGLGMSLFDTQTDGNNIKMLMVYKEVFAIILVVLLFFKFRKQLKLLRYEISVPLFIVFILLNFATSSADMESRAYYLRGFCIVFISYFIGRLLFFSMKNKQINMQKIMGYVVAFGVVATTVGFIFDLIDRNSPFWKDWFSMGYIMQAKGTMYTDFPDWRTPIGDYYIPRMFSFFFDAINISYFIMTAMICSLFIRDRGMMFVRFFLFCGLIMTFGKGAIGIYACVIFWNICLYNLRLPVKPFVTAMVLGVTGAFFVLKGSGIKSSIIVHFDGFIMPLLNSPTHPLGNGIGNGGVYYAMKNNILAYDISHMGAESFFGTMLYQLGYPGTIFYMVFIIGSIGYLLKAAYVKGGIDYNYIVLSGVFFALFTVSLFQEATFGINYTGVLTIMIGFYISKIQYDLKKEKESIKKEPLSE